MNIHWMSKWFMQENVESSWWALVLCWQELALLCIVPSVGISSQRTHKRPESLNTFHPSLPKMKKHIQRALSRGRCGGQWAGGQTVFLSSPSKNAKQTKIKRNILKHFWISFINQPRVDMNHFPASPYIYPIHRFPFVSCFKCGGAIQWEGKKRTIGHLVTWDVF